MNFFYYSTNDLLNFLTGDKKISKENYEDYLVQLFERTENNNELDVIIKRIRANLNLNFEQWKFIYKTLILIENLIKGGSKIFLYEIKNCKEIIYVLTKFKYEVNGAENIREKAKNIYQILENDDLIEKIRDDYIFEKEKERKEETAFQGGLLGRLGSYTFEKDKKEKEKMKKKASFKKKKNIYDLTNDDNDDSSSSSSSSDDDNNQNNNNNKNNNKNTNNKNNNNSKNNQINNNNNINKQNNVQNNDFFPFDFIAQNNQNQQNIQNQINSMNNGINLLDLNPIQDNQINNINLQNNLNSNMNQNNNGNNNQGYYNPFVEFEKNSSSNINNTKSNNINLIEF